ncbi:type II toxin-antitoxin system HicB family antitoxin [Fusobacterium sp. SB021]|uniref:type II toxin-antitoxin system HicB family antitoxin n=1 Tax=Fusobacterium sp. SB021 TaxID=2744227 RepID=UPI003A2DBADA
MKDIYIFPAVFLKEEDGYSVSFPDIDGAFTCGETFEEALFMAKDCLELNLDTVDEIPHVTDIDKIKLNENEYLVMVQADMLNFRKKNDNKPVKKTLTIPKWLNDLGIEKKINFSKVLQEALKEKLQIN